MKNIITCLILLQAGTVFAQNELSTLNIRGTASINVRPTQTVVTFRVSETKISYEECIEELSSKVNLLSKSLQKAGFNQQNIKTSNFNIQKNIVYEKGQREEKGYIASQTVRVTFQQTKEQLLEVLNETTSSKANASIQISFELNDADKKRFRDELIKLAVADAHSKAEIIVGASNYTITGIKKINYLTGNNNRPPIALRNTVSMESSASLQNLEAADLALSEQIDIEFTMEKK